MVEKVLTGNVFDTHHQGFRGKRSSMDSHEGVLQAVKDWIEATSELLLTQSSLEQLSPSDVDTIVNQLRIVLSSVGSLDDISTVCVAVGVLLEVTGDMSDNRDEALELLQLMLNEVVELATTREEMDIKEMDCLGESLSQLVERCGQGIFTPHVLDGVAGHLLELVGKEEVATNVRKSFLRTLLFLANSTETEERERLGEEYASDLGNLVDWLYNCGDFATQVALVELLLR